MNHKQITAHIRSRIKHAGIFAKVKMQACCGDLVVAVDVPKYEAEFTDFEQRQIRLIAKVNKLTWARGMEIDIDQMTNPKSFKFYFLSAG